MRYLKIMEKNNFWVRIILIMSITQNIAPSLAPSLRPCPRNSMNIANCVKQAIELLKPQLSTGVFGPNLIIEEHLNPLVIGDVAVNRNLNLKLSGLNVYGLDNFKIEKIRLNPEKFKLEMIVFFPHVDGTAKYNLKWGLGILSLQGSGDNRVTLDNISTIIKMAGTKYIRNGQEYLKVDYVQLQIRSAQLKSYFNNLFNGQKALEKTANDIINQNIDILKGDVFPIIEQNLSKILLKITNQVFSSAPFNEFFPIN